MWLLRGEQHALQLSECGSRKVRYLPCRSYPVEVLMHCRADRANQQIIDQLASHKDEIKALKENWGGRFDKLEQMIQEMTGGRTFTIERSDTKPPQLKLESPPGASTGQLPGGVDNSSSDHIIKDAGIVNPSPSSSLTESMGSDPVAVRTNEIYIAHNTAAQKLFRWRSIKQLLRQSSKLELPERAEGYVMDYELNKGVMRIYGKGRQVRDSGIWSPMTVAAASPTPSNLSGHGDETSTASSPAASPSESLWGTGFTPTVPETRPVSDVGGLNPDNTLKLEARTITRLLQSYLDNIHILHPFLDQRELTRTVEHFKRRHNTPLDTTSSSKVGFAVPVNPNLDVVRDPHAILNRAQKRKHSEGQYYNALGEPSMGTSPISPNVVLEKSPETALTLLVLALGKICECRTPLPGPVPDNNTRDTTNHIMHPYSPSRGQTDSPPPPYSQPMRHSPSGSSHSTASTSALSPMSAGRLAGSSPRSSFGEPSSGARNVDVIPGLAYYAQATDILGPLTGSQELTYAQCCLLAGLYAGQLANTLESLTWIQTASRICRLLVSE